MIWYSGLMALLLFCLTLSLPPQDLVLWTNGFVAFLYAKAAPAYLPTALTVALRPLFPFWQAQYVQVFPLKPAPFWVLFAGVGSTSKSVISLLPFDSRPVLSSIFPFISKLCGRSGRNCLLSRALSDYTGSPNTRFSQGNDAAGKLARRGALLAPSAISQSLVSTIVFLGLEAYCLIEILRHSGFLNFNRGTCAPSSCSLCPLSSSLQQKQPSVRFLSH